MKKTNSNLFNFSNISFNNKKLLNILINSLFQNKHYFLKQNNKNVNNLQKIANQILHSYFSNININKDKMNVLISNPIFDDSVNKINITVFYYYSFTKDSNSNSSIEIFTSKKLLALCDTLSLLFEKKVNIECIQIHYPYLNSNILAQYLVVNANTNTFLNFSESILTYPSLTPSMFGKIDISGKNFDSKNFILSSYITDIRLELSGRLITEQQIPRVTKKGIRISNPNSNIGSSLTESGVSSETIKNQIIDYSKYTSKNELGTFTLKVWITSVITVEK